MSTVQVDGDADIYVELVDESPNINVTIQGAGPRGPAGPQGEQGPQGETGPKGDDGTATDEQVEAAVAAQIQDVVDDYLTDHPAMTGMFTNAAKNSLIALLEKVAYIDGNGQQYLNELITNLAATVTSISAVFTQGVNTVYNTDSLETLKQYLVVTATYSDGTSGEINNYTLSGSLTPGTSTITATYNGQSDTFNVTVTKGFLYTPDRGILSEQSYISNTNPTNYTETITTNGLRLYCPQQSAQGSAWYMTMGDLDFTTSAHMELEIYIVNIGYYASNNATTPGVFSLFVSDGTNGGSYTGFSRVGSSSGTPKLRTMQGSTVTASPDCSLNNWHTLVVDCDTTGQTVKLDGVTVLNNASISGAGTYGSHTAYRILQSASNAVDLYIRRIELTVDE